MNTTQKITSHTYLTQLTCGILAYADQHDAFAQWLHALIAYLPTPTPTTPVRHTHTPLLTPHDEATAAQRAHWLLSFCTNHHSPDTERASLLLTSWASARTQEEPKAVVLGLDVGWLPVGIMGKMKRRYEPMDILIRRDIAQNMSIQEMRTITNLTHQVLERELLLAQGTTKYLTPEVGDWLFGDKQLALYTAPKQTLRHITDYANSLGAPHAYATDHKGITTLALTPTLYLLDLPHAEELVVFEEATQ